MSNENLIHVKLEYEESLQAKSNILYLETNLLKILRSMRMYHELRMEELILKMNLSRKIKTAENSIKNLRAEIPRPVIPKIIRDETNLIEFKEKENEDDLEAQLKEINEKLKSIGR